MIDRAEVLALFSSQFWVADIAQLKELGVGARTITRARRRGTIVGVLPGIVRIAGSRGDVPVASDGPPAPCRRAGVPQRASAGVLHGLRQMPRSFVEVTVPEDQPVVMPAWGRQVRTSWIGSRARRPARAPTACGSPAPLRTLFRLAAMFNDHRFERAAEDAWHLGLVTPADAADYLAAIRRSGRSGVARFERWLEKTLVRPRPSQSGLELDVLDALRARRPPGTRAAAPRSSLRSGEVIHVDLAWPTRPARGRAGHSWWHGGDLGKRADQARDRACDEIGWRIVRHDESFQRRRRSLRPGRSGSSTTSACGRCVPAPDGRSRPVRGHSWPISRPASGLRLWFRTGRRGRRGRGWGRRRRPRRRA